MKISKILFFFFFFLISLNIFSQVHVKGYYRKNGTYVQSHYRSLPNRTKSDNYSTKGNINPYTGKEGTKKVNRTKSDNYSTKGDINPYAENEGAKIVNSSIYISETNSSVKPDNEVTIIDIKNGFEHFYLGDDIRLDKYSDKLDRTHLNGLESEYIYTGNDVRSLFYLKINSIFFTFYKTSLYKIVVYFETNSYPGLYLGLTDVYGDANSVNKETNYAVWNGEKVEMTLMEGRSKKSSLIIVDNIQKRKAMQEEF